MSALNFSISKEGIRWFGGFALLACVLYFAFIPAAVCALILGVLAALFFRVPLRHPPEGEKRLLSPADGKVVVVDRLEETSFMQGPCQRIAIFLSIFDVHMNYAPASGMIDWVRYQEGAFHWAFEPKSSEKNENQSIGISCIAGRILVRQIAGTIARRIVLFKNPSDRVRRGEIIGMIKFGSRVEIYLPCDVSLKVQVGDRVAGGLTVIAEVP